MNSLKFALRSLSGKAVQYFKIEKEDLATKTANPAPVIGHHCIVVDRSGSMYYDMKATREMLVKVLTVDEYQQEDLYVSLLSYSGQGDLIQHFVRVKVRDIMDTSKPYLNTIQNIQATGLTCMSQALEAASKICLAGSEDLQVISLHSDGYANDASPSQEARQIADLVKQLDGMGVICNTVAYNSNSDFKLLSSIANGLNGKCVQASSLKQVYDALYDTTAFLTSGVSPAILIQRNQADYMVYINAAERRCNGSDQDLKIRDKTPGCVYRFTEVDEATYNASPAPVAGEEATAEPLYGFARAKLAEGFLNDAKFAVVATRDEKLLGDHYRCLTNQACAGFAAALDDALFDASRKPVLSQGYGVAQSRPSVLSVTKLLNRYKGDIMIDVPEMTKTYVRRGVAKICGKRDKDTGVLTIPAFDTMPKVKDPLRKCGGFEINQSAATINVKIVSPVDLVERSTGVIVQEVAGIRLDLVDFKQYTVVGDGEVTIPVLPIRISDKRLFRELTLLGLVQGAFDHTAVYRLDLGSLPVVDLNFKAEDVSTLPELMFRGKVLTQILSALQKDRDSTSRFSAEQVEELQKHCISANMYLNFPMTVPYTDKTAAIAKGEIDTRVTYKVNLGTQDILNGSKLHSANKFMDRMYAVQGLKEIDMSNFWTAPAFTHKALGAKLKVTAVDLFQKSIFDDFLGLNPTGVVIQTMKDLGCTQQAQDDMVSLMGRKLPKEEALDLCDSILPEITDSMDDLFETKVCPLVFYVGCTGTLPEDFGKIKALWSDEYAQQFPQAALSKGEKDGVFFNLGSAVLSVYPESVDFSR